MLTEQLQHAMGVPVFRWMPGRAALFQHRGDVLGRQMIAMNADNVQPPLRQVDADQITLLYQGNGAARCGFGGYMPNHRACGRAGKPPVRNQRNAAA